ncbi:GGDEF-domain containing protein [Thiomicrorhabdus immobilis]|uniref:GGDEF-domain containing protein n=1 Tax=Thiomicrorhabdus immobilis TaxID=2791037 RepID=A0ABN6CTF2_9GAMM|nr:EAL domain-containing protein [Thiomicrorhabdus immobilis]BCN92227.1 GGDEF-domain containing protein [Thiomicrorhabdus immobilis]
MNKNIWTVYYLILVISAIGLLGASYAKFSSVHQYFYAENEASIKLLTKSIESSLTENELLLDILGSRLLENNLYQDTQKTHQLLKQTLATKPSLAGFGLIDPNGNFISASGNINASLLPNLLNAKISREDFQKTLNSHNMVIGRSYFFAALDSWVVPLRKALRDSNGNVIAVIGTGVKLKDISRFTGFTKNENKILTVINPNNYYRVFSSDLDPSQYQEAYSQPLPRKILKSLNDLVVEKYKITLNDVPNKMPDIPMNGENYDSLTGTHVIGSLLYNSKYNLWIVLKEPSSQIRNQLIGALSLYLFIFLVIHLTLLWMVKRIHRNESQARETLEYQAEHDSLTALHNRNYLEKHFSELIQSTDEEISLLFVDLDNFKHINDTFGHSTGDKLLTLVAQRLDSFARYSQHIIRFGGDEFVIVMKGQSHHDFDIAKQIIETIAVSYLIDDLSFTIGASVGIARGKGGSCSLNHLLSHADLALYQAKTRKNWVEVFSDELELKSQKTAAIEHHLRSAIEENEIYLNYQPQLNNQTELHGVECLVRWQNSSLGFVPPDEFIKIAEEMGFMPTLGHHITRLALTEMAQLQKHLNKRFHISINASIKQFMQEQFFDDFMDCVTKSGIPPKYITIEVTESILIEDVNFILSILDQFRRKGIAISLDDFGTGYSSLSLLRELPIQELKIDKVFVDDILDDSKDASLVKNIINIANEFDIVTLAEGVETVEQFNKLRAYECDLYQGYYFSKPLAVKDLEKYIEKHNIV